MTLGSRYDEAQALTSQVRTALGSRSGGVWFGGEGLDDAHLCVAVVDLSAEDVVRLGTLAAELGWSVEVEAVRYSERELQRFARRVEELFPEGSEERLAILALAPVASRNKVRVELRRVEPAIVEAVRAQIPPDALSLVVTPGASSLSRDGDEE